MSVVLACCARVHAQVLQESLCGSSKVLLVCNLSPEAASCGETLSSLNFASRAAQVELGQTRRAATPAVGGAAAAGSGGGGGDADSCGDGGRLSPEPSSSSLRAQASGVAGTGDVRGPAGAFVGRAKSPVGAVGGGGPVSGRVGSPGGGAAAPQPAGSGGVVRPGSSRLCDRTSGTGPGLAAAGVSGSSSSSPRVSLVSKPARH
jgi:hypothetical protein